MASVVGSIERIVFRSEESGYTVLSLRMSGNKTLTCVGVMQGINLGETIEATGEYKNHPTYGKQFAISSYAERLPEDQDSIEKYLESGAIKGIGTVLAARIVSAFGDDTLRIIEEEPETLAKVKGISKAKAVEISEQMKEKAEGRRVMLFLQKYGISNNLAVKIYDEYGNETYQILQENPYKLAEDIKGVGFLTADEIASRIGIHVDSDYRIRSGLLYVLNQAMGEGHIFLPREELFSKAQALLGVSSSYMQKHLMDLTLEKKVYQRAVEGEGDEEGSSYVYPFTMYRIERNVARMLGALNYREPDSNEEQVRQRIALVEKKTKLQLDISQKEAVAMAAEHGLMVITGGPGTGKTTTIKSIIHYFEMEDQSIALAAPTGRAAKRMGEATGREAMTIHRLLEIEGIPDDASGEVNMRFKRNQSTPLEADVIIIDEMSMVDLSLMHSLLLAVNPPSRLILVGDENQLPSVGPGNVLKDIIKSGVIPVARLKTIFRQASESDIVVNAHKIISGEPVRVDNRSKDFFLIQRANANLVLQVVLTLVKQKLPPYLGVSPYEIQVLTPMRKGVLGVEELNRILQKYMNPADPLKREVVHVDRTFREGDKVMQIKNNYQTEWVVKGNKGIVVSKGVGVFNGDMGILKRIDEANEIVHVELDEGRCVQYAYKQLEELELAYAITIHKSQGSEYPAVVMPLLTGPAPLMNRNLLYTAVTRAKKCVTIVGSQGTFENMIANARVTRRYSTLDEEIRMVYETNQ